jgi:hypothetical protein
MFTLLRGFTVAMLSLAGTAGILALARLVLVQVRGLRRLSAQMSDPADPPASPWEFSDCGQPPGWLPSPQRHSGHLGP